MRIRKNYYNFSFGQYCGVFVDEKTMKKISKLQYETYEKLMEILENSDEVYVSNWSISKEPEDRNQNDRIVNYFDDGCKDDLKYRLPLLKELFGIRKVDNLYKVSGRYTDSSELAKKEHTKYLLKGEDKRKIL